MCDHVTIKLIEIVLIKSLFIAKVISEPIQLDQYIVIADYHKQNRSEVSVLAGDIVEVIEKNENGNIFQSLIHEIDEW